MSIINKNIIHDRFSRSAKTYDTAAIIQQEMAKELIAILPHLFAPQSVLEIGCGTGLFSQQLLEKLPTDTQYLFNDLSEQVEPFLRKKIGNKYHFSAFDAETHPWENITSLSPPYTLIASSACIQWWRDATNFFTKGYSALAKEGIILFSTFLPDHFKEFRAVTQLSLKYLSQEELHHSLQSIGFQNIQLKSRKKRMHFPTFFDLLKHLQQTGTNALDTPCQWTPHKIKESEKKYRSLLSLPQSTPLPLTYSYILGSATK